jgi:hypothetical protein
MNGVRAETGFSSDAAQATGDAQTVAVEKELRAQEANMFKAVGRSQKAREALVAKGLFGGL